MDRENLFVIVALTAFLGGWADAAAQNAPLDTSLARITTHADVTRTNAVDAGVALNNLLAAKRPAARRFIIEPVVPTASPDKVPTVDTSGQIANFGGALQSFAIVTNTSEVRGTKSPFGGDVTLPLARGRVELFGGIGGVYVPLGSPYTMPNAWLTQIKLGGRVALDPEHHFWLGTTAYYLTNFAEKTRQWGYGSADLTVRFGR
jgi:hypothetical protein